MQQWNQYLDLFPEDSAALSNRGNVKLVLGNPEASIADQNKAIKLEPDLVDPYINRGIAEEALGLVRCKERYLFVIAKESNNFSALYNYANVEIFVKLGESEIYFLKQQN